VTVASDDCAVFAEAAGWIDRHAGVGTPEYLDIEELSSVVGNIAKRRETEAPPRSQPDSAGDVAVHLLNPTSGGDFGVTPAGATRPWEPPRCGPA
jgi:hypothetical protein